MPDNYSFKTFPPSRIATFDIFAVGLQKHHISVLLECDVSLPREKLEQLKAAGTHISFNAWLLNVIGKTIAEYQAAAAYLYSKRRLILFRDVNISVLVEKEVDGHKVPIPMVIEKTQEKSALEISGEIQRAKSSPLSTKDIVLNRKPGFFERLYYHLPGALRRAFWRWMLQRPKFAYGKMGNAVFTSIGMMGRIDGWFIQRSVHPISFGIGSIIKKPVVLEDEIAIREMLKMTILMDHDVMDGAPMARFVNKLVASIEAGEGLEL